MTEYVYQMDDSLLSVIERTRQEAYTNHGAAVARLQTIVDAINTTRRAAAARTTFTLEDLVVADPGMVFCSVVAGPNQTPLWAIDLVHGDILAVNAVTGIPVCRGDANYLPRGNIWQENPLRYMSISGELMPGLHNSGGSGKKKTENLSISTCANTRNCVTMSYALDA
jgi:hypothetical protein